MPASVAGKVLHSGGKVELIFKVSDRYYPYTVRNGELIDSYLRSGDSRYLDQLEGKA